MHIGFITPEFITDEIFSGGLANYLYRVSKALIALGHEIDIIVLSKSSSHPFKYDEIQIHPIKLYMAKHRLNKITRRRLYSTLRNLDFSHKAYKRIAQIHKDNPFDVVQLSSYQACGLHTALFAKVPHVSRISSYQPACNKYSRRNRTVDTFCSEWLERLQLQYCRHIYAPSHLLKHILLKKARASKIDVIRTPFFMEEDSWDTSFVEEYDLLKKKYLLFFWPISASQRFSYFSTSASRYPRYSSRLLCSICGSRRSKQACEINERIHIISKCQESRSTYVH